MENIVIMVCNNEKDFKNLDFDFHPIKNQFNCCNLPPASRRAPARSTRWVVAYSPHCAYQSWKHTTKRVHQYKVASTARAWWLAFVRQRLTGVERTVGSQNPPSSKQRLMAALGDVRVIATAANWNARVRTNKVSSDDFGHAMPHAKVPAGLVAEF